MPRPHTRHLLTQPHEEIDMTASSATRPAWTGPMNIVWAALIVLVVTAAAVAVMLAVRRRAPEGSYFADSDRAAGIFGVLATGFSVLLGFLIFLGFESYDASRVRSRDRSVDRRPADPDRPDPARRRRRPPHRPAGLLCRGGSSTTSGTAWRTARSARTSTRGAPPCSRRCRTSSWVRPNRRRPTASGWTRPPTGKRPARTASTASAGLMPTPLWIALFFISAIVLAYILGFADSSERVWVQGMFMGSVVAVITTMLLLLAFLDQPYRGDIGGLQPVAMERTELLIDQQLAVIGGDLTIPCDDAGNPA